VTPTTSDDVRRAAFDALASRLESPDWQLRYLSARGAAQIDPTRAAVAVATITGLLEPRDLAANLRFELLATAAAIGEAGLSALAVGLTDDLVDVQLAAAEHIARMQAVGPDATNAERTLQNLLASSSDERTRRAAKTALDALRSAAARANTSTRSDGGRAESGSADGDSARPPEGNGEDP